MHEEKFAALQRRHGSEMLGHQTAAATLFDFFPRGTRAIIRSIIAALSHVHSASLENDFTLASSWSRHDVPNLHVLNKRDLGSLLDIGGVEGLARDVFIEELPTIIAIPGVGGS
eukprot:6349755-Pyramimonas_sp.AAC.1